MHIKGSQARIFFSSLFFSAAFHDPLGLHCLLNLGVSRIQRLGIHLWLETGFQIFFIIF